MLPVVRPVLSPADRPSCPATAALPGSVVRRRPAARQGRARPRALTRRRRCGSGKPVPGKPLGGPGREARGDRRPRLSPQALRRKAGAGGAARRRMPPRPAGAMSSHRSESDWQGLVSEVRRRGRGRLPAGASCLLRRGLGAGAPAFQGPPGETGGGCPAPLRRRARLLPRASGETLAERGAQPAGGDPGPGWRGDPRCCGGSRWSRRVALNAGKAELCGPVLPCGTADPRCTAGK